jgi:four helix bundle protein
MASDFKRLRAYQLAAALADDVYALVKRWPEFDRDTMGKQIVRSADSVAANIAEGMRRRTLKSRRAYLEIALNSLGETENFLERARRRGLITDERTEQVDETARVLHGLYKRPM